MYHHHEPVFIQSYITHTSTRIFTLHSSQTHIPWISTSPKTKLDKVIRSHIHIPQSTNLHTNNKSQHPPKWAAECPNHLLSTRPRCGKQRSRSATSGITVVVATREAHTHTQQDTEAAVASSAEEMVEVAAVEVEEVMEAAAVVVEVEDVRGLKGMGIGM